MLRTLAGLSALALLIWAGAAHALGLGDIRMRSALNEPLDAEIVLLSPTPEELRNLDVELASAQTFRRYGIDRPQFLTGLRFEVDLGRGVVSVSSSEPITEPFVTLLVQATWPRGSLLREYTVLLDPPSFAAAPPPAPARTAPRSAQTQQGAAGRIRRTSEPAAAPQPSRAAPAGDRYVVQRGDTLWEIATRLRPGSAVDANQMMLALYEANREAFDGNINRLNAGAVLRIPPASEISAINRQSARAEVRRQMSEWRASADTGAGTLRLVPPDEEAAGAPSAGVGEPAGEGAVSGAADARRIRELEAQIADRERLLAVRDQELAELRERLAALEGGESVADTPRATGEPGPAAGEEPGTTSPGVDLETGEGEIFVDTAEPETPATETREPSPAETAAPVPERQPPAATQPAEPEGGLLATLSGIFSSLWFYLLLALLAVGIAVMYFVRRVRGDAEATGTWEALEDEEADEEAREATERLRAMAREDESIVVVEQEKPGAGPAAAAGAAAAAASAGGERAPALVDEPIADPELEESAAYSLEDTFSSETAINLDQSDPLAEADFHMAYGLYDQAADLVNNALAADPDNTDLKAKLAEIYFVWGNKESFVEAAQSLRSDLGDEPGELWDKIVIMGQQIAPDEELFAGATPAGGVGSVDLDLDVEGGSGTLDIDLDESGEEVFAGAGEETGVHEIDEGLDFVFDESGGSEPAGSAESEQVTEVLTGEEPTVEQPAPDDTQESPTIEQPLAEDTQETPTIEQPAPGDGPRDSLAETQESPTIESSVLDQTSQMSALEAAGDGSDDADADRGEATAEIDLDDLGLDLDSLELDATGERPVSGAETASGDAEETGDDDSLLEATGETQVLDEEFGVQTSAPSSITEDDDDTLLAKTGEAPQIGDDDATMLAPAPPAEEGRADTGEVPDEEDVRSADVLDRDPEVPLAEGDLAARNDEDSPEDTLGDTDRSRTLGGTDVDVDLSDLTAALKRSDLLEAAGRGEDETVEQPLRSSGNDRFKSDVFSGDDEVSLDLDVGDDIGDDDESPTATSVMESDGGESRTMTEVGTKLDLARAYIDMGDPDGARSILHEVLEEGDSGQQQEANRLLEDLAG